MTVHDHSAFVEGCGRCELSRDEGGDGSPQLDLDAIERQALAQLDITRSRGGFDREASTTAALVALVRRLQQSLVECGKALDNADLRAAALRQENEELRDERDAVQERAHIEHECWANAEAICDALRGRVEELTEALRAVKADRPSAHSDVVWQKINDALAKVVPEKETP